MSIVDVAKAAHGSTPVLVELRLESVVEGHIDLSSNGTGVAIARLQESTGDDVETAVVTEIAIVASQGMLHEARYSALRRVPIPSPGKISTQVSEPCATFDEALADGSGHWLVSVPSKRILDPLTPTGPKPKSGPPTLLPALP